MKEGAAGSRGEEVAMEVDVVEERLEEVEEAGPSFQVAHQQATFKGTGRGAAMRHLVLPPNIGQRGKCIVCVLRLYFNVKLFKMFFFL